MASTAAVTVAESECGQADRGSSQHLAIQVVAQASPGETSGAGTVGATSEKVEKQMRVWVDGEIIQCAAISVGAGELIAIPVDSDHIDISYTDRPTFRAYKAIHYTAIRHKDNSAIGDSLLLTVTRLNYIFQGKTPDGRDDTLPLTSTKILTTPLTPDQMTPLEVSASSFLLWEVRYFYIVQNNTQVGGFSVTQAGIENHVFWGVDDEICEFFYSVGSGQVLVVDRFGVGGTLIATAEGKIPVPRP